MPEPSITVSLRQRARGAIAWTAAARIITQTSSVVTFVVAARLLGPTVYGEYAVVAVVVTFASIFNDLGLQAALVHSGVVSRARLATAFYMNLGAGMALFGLVTGVARPISALFGEPAIQLPLIVGAGSFVVSMAVVPMALLERDLRFGWIAIVEAGSSVAAGAATIVLAAGGAGLYSLALNPVIVAMTMSLGLYAVTRYVPKAVPRRRELAELWSYSSGLIKFNVINFWSRNIDNLALAKFGSARDLGLYSRAYNLMALPVFQVGLIVGRVLFPILTRTRDDRALTSQRWLRGAYPAVGLTVPLSVLTIFAAHSAVRTLLTPAWEPMASLLVILCLAAPVQIFCATLGCVYQAFGRTNLLFKVGLLNFVCTASGVAIGVSYGAQGVAIGVCAASWVAGSVPIYIGLNLLELRFRVVAQYFTPIFVAGTVELAVGALLHILLSDVASSLLVLCLLVVGCPAGYVAGLRLTGTKGISRLLGKPGLGCTPS